jgi:polysaccharide export outer membrane protein
MSWIAKTGLVKVALVAGVVLVAQAADPKKTAAIVPPGQPEYRLGPEDVISVFVWKEPELTTTVVVRPDGKISLPLTNELEASGKTAVELQREITEGLGRFINDPVVNVIVKQVNSLKISVLGEVRKPDVYKIQRQVTVLEAIAMAGGFTDFAKRNKVLLIRNTSAGPQRFRVDVRQLIESDTGGQPYLLFPQDTIYVE